MEDLLYISATALARAIRAREITSLEVTEAHIARIAEVNPYLNAVVQLTAESAIEASRHADAALARGETGGPLYGVPMTIKDSFETRGVITTAGTKGLERYVPNRDATVVARLKGAGAILLGKTNTPELTLEFVTDNFVYGRTNNPYDLARSPAGSSGGAAAIVAAGGAPFDIGTDYAGSIRLPAHFCGIAGLKSTAGRVPRTGHIPFLEAGPTEAFIHVGPLARYVEDLRLILPIISGTDWRDPMISPMPLDLAKALDLKDLRVAFYTDNGITSPSAQTVRIVKAAAGSLADCGATLVEDRPPGMELSPEFWTEIVLADGGRGIKDLLSKLGTKEMHPLLTWTRQKKELSSVEFARALVRWSTFRSQGSEFLENYDLIVCPVRAGPATLHDEISDFNYTEYYNLMGWPVVVVRCGTSPEGLPIGVQIVARPWREDVALAAAQPLENTFGGWQKPPI